MRILWICGLPKQIKDEVLGSSHGGNFAAWSWILAHFPPPSEVELHVACLLAGGEKRRDFIYQGVHFHLLPAPTRGRALTLFAGDAALFRPLFRELCPAVVHGWGTEDSFGLVARRLAPQRHVVGIQGLISAYRQRIDLGPRSLITQLTENWTLRKAKCVVAESAYSARIAHPLSPHAKMSIIEHPLRAEFLHAVPTDGTQNRVLFVGAIDERKGISDALRAFAATRQPQWSLHVVGAGPTMAEQSMHRLAAELQIQFHHDQTLSAGDLVKVMQASSVFLLPTKIDTGPTALKEALAMGLWPVCYDNSGPAEYVRKLQFGTLAVDQNLADLSQKLRTDLNAQPWNMSHDRDRLAAETRSLFSPETAWELLLELYRRVDESVPSPDSGTEYRSVEKK